MLTSNRLIGGTLLVAGTAIGAGMLALPVITCYAGFFPSFLALAFCWLFMYATAVLVLHVNLSCPDESNMISMAGKTLGSIGKAVCWVVYLLLLYSLTAAYIAGSAPLFLQFVHFFTGIELPAWIGPFPLLILFGVFVYLGTRAVDQVNRYLMIGLIVSYFALIVYLPPHVDVKRLYISDFSTLWIALPVLFTSFGFHIIIPSLSTYLRHDEKKLHFCILVGSLIPFAVYVIWEFLILGAVPFESLAEALDTGTSAAAPLATTVKSTWISTAASAFSFFAIITSFLGVSLSLSDFLGDGLKLHRFSMGREFACLLTFSPPLVFALTYQRGFLLALSYAGLFVAILLGILPALMAWNLKRYRHPAMKLGLMLIMGVSAYVILICLV